MMHKSGRTDTQTPGSSNQERYLRDYIEQVQAGLLPSHTSPATGATKKKLTFEEWWDSGCVSKDNPYRQDSAAFWAYEGWKAAQENM